MAEKVEKQVEAPVPVFSSTDAVARLEILFEILARGGKEMYSVCFGDTDKRTKASVLPLLMRVSDFEICSTLLIVFIRNDENKLQELTGKMQAYADEMQKDLTDLKAKISVNKDFLKQIKGDYESFCHTFDEMTQLLTRIDKRVEAENTTRRNEPVHKLNMELIEAEIKMMQTEKAKNKATEYLSEMNEQRRATEVKLIDAFEEIIMETESRQLILAEQAKKKAEALCLRAEKKHTDVEIWFLKLKEDHRALVEAYIKEVSKRHNIKVKSNSSKQKSKCPSESKNWTSTEHLKGKSPNEKKKSRSTESTPKLSSKEDKKSGSTGSTPLLSPKAAETMLLTPSRNRKSSSSGDNASDATTPRLNKKVASPRIPRVDLPAV